MLPTEIRQTAAHSEVLIISDTAPPIRAAYPPFAVLKGVSTAAHKGDPPEINLGDIVAQFSLVGTAPVNRPAVTDISEQKEHISRAVDHVFSKYQITEGTASTRKAIEPDELQSVANNEEDAQMVQALDGLADDVRFKARQVQNDAVAMSREVRI